MEPNRRLLVVYQSVVATSDGSEGCAETSEDVAGATTI